MQNVNTSNNGQKNNAAHSIQNAADHVANDTANRARSQIDATKDNMNSSLHIAAESARRSLSGLQEAFTGEKAKDAMKQSLSHVEAISAASSVLSQSFQDVSREWMNFAKQGAAKSQEALSAFTKCRSPNEFFEVQSRYLKDNLGLWVASAQRVSEISTNAAKDATQKIISEPTHS